MDKKILRVIDANYNRCKEGLRVIEDAFRFVFEDDRLRRQSRRLRHALDDLVKQKTLRDAIALRESRRDLGRKTDGLEIKRKDCREILYANLTRVKESLRVLEEFLKIISPRQVALIKRLRYKAYTLEKNILIKYPPRGSK